MSFFKWSLLTLSIVASNVFGGPCTLTESQEDRLREEAKKALAAMYSAGDFDTPCGHSRLSGGYESNSWESTSPRSTSPLSSSPQANNPLTMSMIFPSQQK